MSQNKKVYVLLLGISIISILCLTGCSYFLTSGSGNVVEREFQFSDFDQVEVGNAFRGTITAGDTFSVIVRVDDNLEQYLRVEQNGDRVTIGLDPQVATSRSTLEYEIVMPELTALNASGATQAELSGFSSTKDVRLDASGASRIEGDFTAADVNANASGASTINLSGSGEDLKAEASGASTIDMENFQVNDADAVANGASTIRVNANGQLNADASGASNIQYSGNPTMGNIQQSGGASVRSR